MPLRELLTSDDVNEVCVNPDGGIWVENAHQPHMQPVELDLPPQAIKSLGSHLAAETRNSLGKDNPIVSGRVRVFDQSMRVQVIVPPAIEDGVSVSIRKYMSRRPDIGAIEFLHGAQIRVEDARRERLRELSSLAQQGELQQVFERAVAERMNILMSGSTSSGKTTIGGALLAVSDHEERLVLIEDAPELFLPHGNQVGLVADREPGSARSPARLLESALRMRPDRLILGEIRGEEALNFLEAINTGHPGSISTIHADSPQLALERMALMVMRTGIQMTRDDVLEYAKRTIDMIVQVGRDGGRRGVLEIHMPQLMIVTNPEDS